MRVLLLTVPIRLVDAIHVATAVAHWQQVVNFEAGIAIKVQATMTIFGPLHGGEFDTLVATDDRPAPTIGVNAAAITIRIANDTPRRD